MVADLSDFVAVGVRAATVDALFEFIRTNDLDYGCRPMAREADGGLETVAYVTHEDLASLRVAVRELDVDIVVLHDSHGGDREPAPIGEGDRFDGGRRAPRGLGSDPEQDLHGIMNPGEIGSAIDGLVNEYGIPTFDTPNATAEGSGGKGGSIGGIDPDAYHVFFTAGVHARERGGPDNLIYFIADLLFAQKHGTGLTYGARSYSHAQVLDALSTGIVFFPLVNPDGVRWDQATSSMWRKNRNPTSATPGDPKSIGVDINRNYDFLWDFRRHFKPSVALSSSLASDDPAEETFHGVAPFSEPESRNVAWVFDQFRRIRWYMDIHSAFGSVLYPWGDDAVQVNDPGQTFLDPAFDQRRGDIPDTEYREYLSEADLGTVMLVARRTAGALHAVGGSPYRSMPAADLYATSGTSDDYATGRGLADPNLGRAYGFTMEFGLPYHFYPTHAEFVQNVRDTGAGLLEFCLAAKDAGQA